MNRQSKLQLLDSVFNGNDISVLATQKELGVMVTTPDTPEAEIKAFQIKCSPAIIVGLAY